MSSSTTSQTAAGVRRFPSLPCLASPAASSTDTHPLASLSPLQSPTRARSTMSLSSSRTTQVRLASTLGSRKAGREGTASGSPLGGNASVACASRPIPPFPPAASVRAIPLARTAGADQIHTLAQFSGGDDVVLPYAGRDISEVMADPGEHEHSKSAYVMMNEVSPCRFSTL